LKAGVAITPIGFADTIRLVGYIFYGDLYGKQKGIQNGDETLKLISRINCESYHPRRPWEQFSVSSISWRRGVAFLGFGARRSGWSSGWRLNFFGLGEMKNAHELDVGEE
jgi:hypothetical protein